jgi:AraC-like DNA-binding protein
MRMQILAVTMDEKQISDLTKMAKELGMTRSNLVRILTSSGLENLSSYPLEKRIEIVKSKLNQNEKELK